MGFRSPTVTAVLATVLYFSPLSSVAAEPQATENASQAVAEALAALQLREIGPAVMGGRIADVAVHPQHRGTWYLAVGSGGIWKTVNAGTTWTPLFDEQKSYSTSCVTLDPANPEIVWVGTGENVSGRHVGWGDGVYRSLDGGLSWQHMGLSASEHIGDIVIDPRDSNVVWVAAEGPLWSEGGERGLYKSTDGGTSWHLSLEIDADTGVTDLELDPRSPDTIYAATYQRRRQVWSLLAGGPQSGIHKSTDGGGTWRRLGSGLPAGDMGKIGLAVSPANPDIVYATIEADEAERGFYRSINRGETFEHRNSYLSNGTGPHYYQEIVASPHDANVVYQMDVFLHVTRDGGANFEILGNGREKHSDNHALVIDPQDPKHLLAGTDGGLYESWDDGTTWRHYGNLPISQFYKMALDNAEPFYNILGGAQDLGTLLGPSRTTSSEGVRNGDWYVPLGADGYACSFDRADPDLIYMQWQGGRLYRYDRRSEEALDIRPQPAVGDPPERWNWDSPVITSAHSDTRIYYASQRLWRSNDRGDSWTAVSGDLTTGKNRYELPMAGRVRSANALYDNGAMSLYATLTTVAESPHSEDLLYTGSDDGLVQVSDGGFEEGGSQWRRTAALPGVPELSFINDLMASDHDVDTVFVAADAHKFGDYRPLIFRSQDRGRTWQSIAGDLPEDTIVWALAQDTEVPELLFAGTEFGLYTTLDGGKHWHPLSGGMPTISVRDLAVQPREHDLVAATFGRGFYVLDDYSPLRAIAAGALDGDSKANHHTLFAVRDAWSYVPLVPMQARGMPSQSSAAYRADNPPFGAIFTYFLSEVPTTAKKQRLEAERKLSDDDKDVPFAGWETLRQESLQQEPQLVFSISNSQGKAVRRLQVAASAGLHRIAWDLRRPPADPVELEPPAFRPPWAEPASGPLVPPGQYRVTLSLLADGQWTQLGEAQEFKVKALERSALPLPDFQQVASFQEETRELLRQAIIVDRQLGELGAELHHLRAALAVSPAAPTELNRQLETATQQYADLRLRLNGDRIRGQWNESAVPSVLDRAQQVAYGHWETRQQPTQTHRQSLAVAKQDFVVVKRDFASLDNAIDALQSAMEAAGAPWTKGRQLPQP